MSYLTENLSYYIFIFSILMSLCSLLFMIFLPKFYPFIFGECISNNKTSKFHIPMARGLGIVFPLALIISSIFFDSNFNFFEICIISFATLVGLWDDKYGLGYKSKLSIFLVLGLVYAFYSLSNEVYSNTYVLKLILNGFIFIFLILFFNQIDGVNGLAASTFLICICFLSLNGINLTLSLPVIFSVFTYLFINMKGDIGIQGDAGSFFMGSFTSILFIKSLDYIEYGLIFFVISPILFDICATTMVKLFKKVDLSLGHKDNIYQKLVSRYQNHYLVTIIFSFSQVIFCLCLTFIRQNYSIGFIYILLIITGILFNFLFCYLAYSIHNQKLLK